jgi:hypothetical protein
MRFLTTVHCEKDQIFYSYTDTREKGFLKALAYIAEFSNQGIKNSLTVAQGPHILQDYNGNSIVK